MNSRNSRTLSFVAALLRTTTGISIAALTFSGGAMPMLHAGAAADTTITIKASSSSLEFDPPNISAKQRTRVRLVFVNAGTLPHNFVIARTDDDIDVLAPAAMQAGGDYIPLSIKDRMIAYTKLASPGQTVEVTFVMPPPGTYTYVCLMSGHANSMLGKLRSLR